MFTVSVLVLLALQNFEMTDNSQSSNISDPKNMKYNLTSH